MNPLVIAQVLPSFGLGGQERVAISLAAELKSSGHEVVAISLAPQPDGPMAGRFRALGVQTRAVPKLSSGLDLSLPVRLAQQLRWDQVAVVHAHNPHSLIYGAPAARMAGASAIYTCHGESAVTPGRLWLTRLASMLIDTYVGVSPAIAARARSYHECAAEKVDVIENGIDLSEFRPDARARVEARCELGIPSDAFVVGTVGRLVEEKNPELLLRAVRPLLGARQRLLFVGHGPLAEHLQAQVAREGCREYVHFTGLRSDVARLMTAMDVFVLSSRTEGLPLALLEAMAVGLPVVATRVGGIPDVVHDGESGRLLASEDEAALRSALSSLIENPDLLARMAGNALKRSEAFSVKTMARRYLEVYLRCCKPSRHQYPRNLV